MAIDRAALDLWALVRDRLPRTPAVLELGQANWFGDVLPSTVPELAGVAGADDLLTTPAGLYRLARLYYVVLLAPGTWTTVDAAGVGPGVHAWDLNEPLPLPAGQRYDVVINTGTAEHVFDQRRVFTTAHDACAVGGVMVHALPVGGCPDHGWYTYQPSLLRALALANGYAELAALEHAQGGDRVLHVAWRRLRPGPFVVPQQGALAAAGIMGGRFSAVPDQPEGGRAMETTNGDGHKATQVVPDEGLLPGAVELEALPLHKLLGRQLAETDRHRRELDDLRVKAHWLITVLSQVADGRTLPCQVAADPAAGTATVHPLTPAMRAAVADRDRAWAEYLERTQQAADPAEEAESMHRPNSTEHAPLAAPGHRRPVGYTFAGGDAPAGEAP